MLYRIIAITHLLILVFYLISPVIPYIHYAVFKEYIEQNLCIKKDIPNNCCRGKCYLEKQVKNAKETGETEERNTNKKVQSRSLNEFLSGNIIFSDLFAKSIRQIIKTETINIMWFVSYVFIPPEIKSIL
jgi:hypothetical protein